MFGIIFFKDINKKKDFMAYTLEDGFLEGVNLDILLKKNKIWISNLKKSLNEFIKQENFFSCYFEEIYYYYNIGHRDISYKIKILANVFNDIEKYISKNDMHFDFNHLLKYDNFYEIFKNIVKINKRDFFKNYSFEKINILKKINDENVLIGSESYQDFYLRVNEIEFLNFIKKIKIPIGEWELIPVEKLGNNLEFENWFNALSKEYEFIAFGRIKSINFKDKKILSKRLKEENTFFFKKEIEFLKDIADIEVTDIYLCSESEIFYNYLNYIPKIKKTTISNRILIRNYIKKLFDEIKEFFVLWFKINKRVNLLKTVYVMNKVNINILAYGNDELIISVKRNQVKNALEYIEKLRLLYPLNLLAFLEE